MQQIEFKLNHGGYFPIEFTNHESCILAFFLTDDANCRIPNWIRWANNPQALNTSSNVSFIGKIENNIYIGDLFSEEEDGGPFFETTKEKFIKMLEDWEALVKKSPKKIFLTINDKGDIRLDEMSD